MDKRQQILEATADLIAAQCIQNCPMASVAKHAGCGEIGRASCRERV